MSLTCHNDPLTCRCWYHQGHVEPAPSKWKTYTALPLIAAVPVERPWWHLFGKWTKTRLCEFHAAVEATVPVDLRLVERANGCVMLEIKARTGIGQPDAMARAPRVWREPLVQEGDTTNVQS